MFGDHIAVPSPFNVTLNNRFDWLAAIIS